MGTEIYAISADGDSVSPHFGRCPSYVIVELKDSKILKKNVINNPGHRTGYIPKFLNELGVNFIISGGMGHRAKDLFREFGIGTILGITGRIEDTIRQILDNGLQGGESTCQPQSGHGYGIPKEDGHHEDEHH